MLRIVPKTEPPQRERIKRMPRPPGIIQCPRCGSRTMMTVVAGSWIDDAGRYHRGAVVEDRVCYECHKRGAWVPMMPAPPKLAK